MSVQSTNPSHGIVLLLLLEAAGVPTPATEPRLWHERNPNEWVRSQASSRRTGSAVASARQGGQIHTKVAITKGFVASMIQ